MQVPAVGLNSVALTLKWKEGALGFSFDFGFVSSCLSSLVDSATGAFCKAQSMN
jgi:hypothetical protein